MTGTSTTNTQAGVVAHALHALADHIERHQLPLFAEFQINNDRLELHLSGHDAEAWWTSLEGCIDDAQALPAVAGSPVEWVTVQGRLPDTGVRVQLQWIRHRRPKAVPA